MSTALPTLSLFRRHVPDVPEDVELMEHFNDPNWDYRPPSPTLSTESIDLDQKEKRADSSRHSTSDFDTESNADSSYGKTAVSYGHSEQNKSQLWSSGASDLEEYVRFTFASIRVLTFFYSVIPLIPKSERQFLISMTPLCQ